MTLLRYKTTFKLSTFNLFFNLISSIWNPEWNAIRGPRFCVICFFKFWSWMGSIIVLITLRQAPCEMENISFIDGILDLLCNRGILLNWFCPIAPKIQVKMKKESEWLTWSLYRFNLVSAQYKPMEHPTFCSINLVIHLVVLAAFFPSSHLCLFVLKVFQRVLVIRYFCI